MTPSKAKNRMDRRNDFRPAPPTRTFEPVHRFLRSERRGRYPDSRVRGTSLGEPSDVGPDGPSRTHHSFPITVAGQLRIFTGFPVRPCGRNPDVVLGAIDNHKIFDKHQKINRNDDPESSCALHPVSSSPINVDGRVLQRLHYCAGRCGGHQVRMKPTPPALANAVARATRNSRSRTLRVSAAARSNSARASSLRPSRASKSPRTLGSRW